jgi:hypothetical protein
VVLARLAEALRGSDDAALSVDVVDVDAAARRRVEVLLHATAYAPGTPQRATSPIAALLRAWQAFTADQLPFRPVPVTDARRQERDRLALRHGRERRL